MVSIHDSVARIYERTGHAGLGRARAGRRRRCSAADCASAPGVVRVPRRPVSCGAHRGDGRRPMRNRATGGRARPTSSRSPRSSSSTRLPTRPNGAAVRATSARAEERYTDAIVELKAALTFAPGNPALLYELASAYYQARDYEQAVATLSPLLRARPDDPRLLELVGYSLLQLRRVDEALPILRRAVERDRRRPGTAPRARSRVSPQRRFRRGHSADRGAARRRPGREPARAARARLHAASDSGTRPRTLLARSQADSTRGRETASKPRRSARTITPPK